MDVTAMERDEIRSMVRAHHGSAAQAQRARLILALAAGETHAEIIARFGFSTTYIARWKGRFAKDRLAGLVSQYAGAGERDRVLTPRLEARILDATRRKPRDGSTHWSTRKLARELGINHMINPPTDAAVFSVDEKTAIQALDRLDPVLPLSPGRAERHGFEYHRHGTLSLYAALNTKTGKVIGKTAARHTSAEFVAFLTTIVASQPRGKEFHVLVDNWAVHFHEHEPIGAVFGDLGAADVEYYR